MVIRYNDFFQGIRNNEVWDTDALFHYCRGQLHIYINYRFATYSASLYEWLLQIEISLHKISITNESTFFYKIALSFHKNHMKTFSRAPIKHFRVPIKLLRVPIELFCLFTVIVFPLRASVSTYFSFHRNMGNVFYFLNITSIKYFLYKLHNYYHNFEVPMTRKLSLYDVKEYLKL